MSAQEDRGPHGMTGHRPHAGVPRFEAGTFAAAPEASELAEVGIYSRPAESVLIERNA
jgi:hypothetical protein